MPVLAPQMPARLARAAFEMFSRHGFRNVTLDAVAARAGVTKGSLYSHYRSKKDLIAAACAYYYRRWQRWVHAEIASLRDPMERLRRVLGLSVHTCVIDRDSRVFTTEIFALSLQDPSVRASWAQFYDTVREFYVALVASACAAGRLKVEDPRAAVDLMLATMEGIKQRASFEPEICDPSEQRAIVEGLLRILRAAPRAGGEKKT